VVATRARQERRWSDITEQSGTETTVVENPNAGQASVLLDIGGDIGALVVTMPAAMVGVEVEIHQVDAESRHAHQHSATDGSHAHAHGGGGVHRPHVAAVARPTAAGVVPSLVFPELAEGTYELYRRPAEPVELVVTIRGGEVTEAVWPD
jgi:hypothetical protein